MAYSDFTVSRVKRELGVTVAETTGLFEQVEKIPSSELLRAILQRSGRLARLIGTEKAKSEFLISPILAEVAAQLNYQVSLFSGTEFNVDAEKGLLGFCDFILSQSPEQLDVTAPVVTIVEAKNDNLKNGIGQCMAEMVAAQIFNEREGLDNRTIYGVVTTGNTWLFMQLVGSHIELDDREYFINEVDQILGILMLPFQTVI
jgi:co-chaperonin GroES (HSP10)